MKLSFPCRSPRQGIAKYPLRPSRLSGSVFLPVQLSYRFRPKAIFGNPVLAFSSWQSYYFIMSFKIFQIVPLLFILCLTHIAQAVTVAPRISDREIIERLTRLEEGQKSLRQAMEHRFNAMQSQIDQRFESLESKIVLASSDGATL